MLRFLAVGKSAFISFHAPLRRFEVVPAGIILASARTLASVTGTVGLTVLASVALCLGFWEHRSGIRSTGFPLFALATLSPSCRASGLPDPP